jgi:hypothetical protein
MPTWVYQSGEMESLTSIQVPMALGIALGSLLTLGIFTGDDDSLRGRNGGRIAAGGSLDVKVGPILVHAGAGVASLLPGGPYRRSASRSKSISTSSTSSKARLAAAAFVRSAGVR